MKPLIGITCNYNEYNGIGRLTCLGMEGQDWNFLAGDYVYSIERAGGIPVLIPQCSSEEQISSLLDRLDGVLISGGHDVDPQHYNARLKSCCGDLSPKRDRQDIAVVRCAYQKKLPILAICRGIQIMNVAFGGTLYQDLALEGGFEYHSCRTSPRNNRVHEILTDEGSILRAVFGDRLRVNSYHHQGVRDLGTNVSAAAHSEDGVIEGIELTGGNPFSVGVQWHPEMMFDCPDQYPLFEAFVEACGNNLNWRNLK